MCGRERPKAGDPSCTQDISHGDACFEALAKHGTQATTDRAHQSRAQSRSQAESEDTEDLVHVSCSCALKNRGG
jgi:hypothetical protein